MIRGHAIDLAFDVAGRGPPVLLLHGLFASSANWRSVADALASAYRVYSVDLCNHGRSPCAIDMSYLAMADDVLRLIEREGLRSPAVVGHSMGGKVAMALALTAPYAVQRVVVIDVAPVTYVDHFSHQIQTMMDTLARQPDAAAGASATPAACPTGATLAHLMMPRLSAAQSYVDWRCNLGVIARSIQGLCAFPRHLRYLSTGVPLTAIVGARSECVHPPSPALYQPMFPCTSVRVIDGAGHWVHADRPRALLAQLRRTLGAPAAAQTARAA